MTLALFGIFCWATIGQFAYTYKTKKTKYWRRWLFLSIIGILTISPGYFNMIFHYYSSFLDQFGVIILYLIMIIFGCTFAKLIALKW